MSMMKLKKTLLILVAGPNILFLLYLVIRFGPPVPDVTIIGKLATLTRTSFEIVASTEILPVRSRSTALTSKERLLSTFYTTKAIYLDDGFCKSAILDTFVVSRRLCSKESGAFNTDPVQCMVGKYQLISRCKLTDIVLTFYGSAPKLQPVLHWSQKSNDQCGQIDHVRAKQSIAIGGRGTMAEVVGSFARTGIRNCSNLPRYHRSRTVFLYTLPDVNHIYFRSLAWHQLFKSLQSEKINPEDYEKHVILKPYHDFETNSFKIMDKLLFPNTYEPNQFLEYINLTRDSYCIERLVISPTGYDDPFFRCKMFQDPIAVGKRCYGCEGRINVTDSSYTKFKDHVLSKCETSNTKKTKTYNVVIIARNPYYRWPTDVLKNFQRTFNNSERLRDAIQSDFSALQQNVSLFPSDLIVNVSVVAFENLTICEQIRTSAQTDLLIGVHGAGLVHMWWMEMKSRIIEIEPSNQRGNRSFKMMSLLLGRNYTSVANVGVPNATPGSVFANIKKIRSLAVQFLREHVGL